MKHNITEQELIDFENDIASSFNNKLIKAPIHLQDNNAKQLIEIFKDINEEDWCCGTWRFHFETILKGVDKERLKQEIINGRSISLCFKDHNIICSAIVSGIVPISLGIAMDIKRKKQLNKVYCFVGEMSASLGPFYESYVYANNHDLPIVFVVSDNGKSVCTDTRNVWKTLQLPFEPDKLEENKVHKSKHLWYYKYNLNWPHAGSGQRINF